MKKLTYGVLCGLLVAAIAYGATVVDVSLFDPVNDRRMALETGGAVPVVEQDPHSQTVGVLFSQVQGSPMTLSSATTVDSYEIEMTAGHTFVAGNEILIAETDRSFHALVLSVATNTLTVNAPMDQVYSTSAIVFEVNSNMNVDGSSTVQEFSVQLGSSATTSLDVTGVKFLITDGTTMDGGTFGGIAALTRGIVFRITQAGSAHNSWTVKTNGKFGLATSSIPIYTDKAPAGAHAVHVKWDIRKDLGVTLRLAPGDKISLLIQDDNTENTTFKAWVYGHHVTD